jgi:paraquat-inducible protein A
MIGCPDCGALETIPFLGADSMARCRTCRSPLERRAGRSIGAALACALATFALLAPANLSPLMHVHLLGAVRTSILGSGMVLMWRRGWVLLALLLGGFGIVLPLMRFAGLSLVLSTVLAGARPAWLGRLFRWVMWLDLWAMPDVLLIGFFIGYSRVSQHLTASIGLGGYCLVAAAFTTMLTRACLDRRTVWRAIEPERELAGNQPAVSCTTCDLVMPISAEGRPCPRCGLTLRTRKPDALVRASALSLAALLLYVPANLYPMTISTQLGRPVPHRIVDGVAELFQAGLWPLGVLIFCTSILIPLVKILGMGWFVASVRLHSRRRLRLKTWLYRLIDEVGRWSNIDVFTLAVFLPLIQFGDLARATAAPGSAAFILVVCLTMAASRTFDPRLMWDAAEGGGG